ncbi:MAG: shikimate dehydrogenase [Lachnospiraceae bacterium]|nr:shikimate dehydrogenase [Lachnospiraceae bacterium]
MEKRISGTTALYALIGSPVGHSGSPAMYNYSFEKLGIDAAYLAFDITVEQVADFIAAAKTLHVKGFNVTMPCKTEVAKQVDELSPAAKIVGAVNTVVIEDGKLTGHITDGVGFIRNLAEHGVAVKGKKLTILGGGGAGTAIQVQAALDGAREISIFNMKDGFFANVEETAAKIRAAVPDCKVNVCDLADEKKLYQEVGESDILINATKIGMKPMEDQSLIKDVSVFRPELVVADVVYNPKETKLVLDAKAAGVKIAIGGSGMLLWQGVEAFRLYTGREMPVKEVQKLFFS